MNDRCSYCGQRDCFGTCLVDKSMVNADREHAEVVAEERSRDELADFGLEMSAYDS